MRTDGIYIFCAVVMLPSLYFTVVNKVLDFVRTVTWRCLLSVTLLCTFYAKVECMRNRTTSYVMRNITSREKKVYAQHTTFYVN